MSGTGNTIVSKAGKTLSLPHRSYSLRVFIFFYFLFFNIKLDKVILGEVMFMEELWCQAAVILNFDFLISSFVTLAK